MDFVATIAPLWKVLAVGILLGAGLPAIFALGMRLQSAGVSDTLPDSSDSANLQTATATARPALGRRIAAKACFAIVVIAVTFGLAVLVGGDRVLGFIGLG